MPDLESMTVDERIQAYLSKMTKADIINALWASLSELEDQTHTTKTRAVMTAIGAEYMDAGWKLPSPTQAAEKVRGSFK